MMMASWPISNGVEIARSNAPNALMFNSTATASRGGEPTAVQDVGLSDRLDLLQRRNQRAGHSRT